MTQRYDFDADILKDLIDEGYRGEALVERFNAIKAEIPNALERLKRETMDSAVIVGDLDDIDWDDDDEDHYPCGCCRCCGCDEDCEG